MTRLRPRPPEFEQIAPLIIMEDARRLWKAGEDALNRWSRETGIAYKKTDHCYAKKVDRPAEFTLEAVHGLSRKQVAAKFDRGAKVIRRWLREIKAIDEAPKALEKPKPPASRSKPPIHRVHTQSPSTVLKLAPASPLPAEPCWRCGARGFCGHDFRVMA